MRWMWIDQIIEYVPGRRLCAVKNVSLSEEHLHDHFGADAPGSGGNAMPTMPASLMIEGMAQTAGILVGSINHFREKVILAKIIAARFEKDVFPGQTILYEAEIEHIDSRGAATSGIVRRMAHTRGAAGEWEEIGAVGLMFSHLDQNLGGLEFPEENFVFSDNFRTILRAAGMDDLSRFTRDRDEEATAAASAKTDSGPSLEAKGR
jgi:3-hydroxyacyl-[acyl-carrier-protein] dehydratase